MIRMLAAVFFILALIRAYFDWQAASLSGVAIEFQPIGQVWFDFDRDSLLGLQPGIERYLSPVIWENAVGPMMLWPLAPALFYTGLFFAAIAIWRAFQSRN